LVSIYLNLFPLPSSICRIISSPPAYAELFAPPRAYAEIFPTLSKVMIVVELLVERGGENKNNFHVRGQIKLGSA
jgi:hypothetical protein